MSTTPEALRAVATRELRLWMRRPWQAGLPVVFLVVAVSLFPLGLGPDPQVLRHLAPGLVWVCALLASVLSLPRLYEQDHADGTLEQWAHSGHPWAALALTKAAMHWLAHGLPLVLVAPLLALSLGMQEPAALLVLVGSLALGTPVLSLLGGVGAALALGARQPGMLTLLMVLPLAVPTLVFGSAAVDAAAQGGSGRAHLSLLGAFLLLALAGAPWGTGAALRLATE